MQGARPIYIYRLAPCTENCSQRIYKTFSIKYLEHVHIFSTLEPKKHKSVFQAAVSTCTLKILCCGYNLATQKRRKFIRNYDTRRYKEYSFSSLSADTCRLVAYSSWISGQPLFLFSEDRRISLGGGLPRCYTPFVIGLHSVCNRVTQRL